MERNSCEFPELILVLVCMILVCTCNVVINVAITFHFTHFIVLNLIFESTYVTEIHNCFKYMAHCQKFNQKRGNRFQWSIPSTFYERFCCRYPNTKPKWTREKLRESLWYEKRARKMMMKLTPGVNFINIKSTNFSFKCHFSSFF